MLCFFCEIIYILVDAVMLISYNDNAILGYLYAEVKNASVDRKDIQKMRLIQKKIKVAVLAMMIIFIVVPAINVQAATGKTTIAVSSDEIDVGESLTVTVKVKTDSGNAAKAKMKLTYDDEILEFVSCSATYDGGAGGSVTATASTMTVKFKAIADGKCPLYVEAGSGVATGSGSSLSAVDGCSTNVTVNKASGGQSSSGNLSKDNSLKKLSLSVGTLSPKFAANVVNYTATVPGDVTEVEVNAVTSNANATIESVAGNTDLQVGLNTIRIVVKAENGALATYTIEVTREEGEQEVIATESEEVPTEVVEDTASKKELEEALERNEFLSNSYKELEEKYQREKDFSRAVIYVLILIIAILIVLLINVIAICFRKMDEDFEDSFQKKKTKKKVPDITEKYPEKVEEKQIERHAEKYVEKTSTRPVEVKREEQKREPVARRDKRTPNAEKTIKKPVEHKDFEVLDFNDED